MSLSSVPLEVTTVHKPESDVVDVSPKLRKIIAVGGGKGGIGKSLLSANIGACLAQAGKRVVLVDGDLGGANLHTCLGVPAPSVTLSDFVSGAVPSLSDTVHTTPVPNVRLISGALDTLQSPSPKYTQKLKLLREITRLDADHVILDLGAGTGFTTLDFFLIADCGLVTVVPEPTSIENAYRFLKAMFYRRFKALELSMHLTPWVEEAASHHAQTPKELIDYVAAKDAQAGEVLKASMKQFPLYLVVNQVRSLAEERLGGSMVQACEKYFGIHMVFLGAVPYDEAVLQAVRRRKLLLQDDPASKAAQAIRAMVHSLGVEV